MPKLLIETYSNYYDIRTRIQFTAILDRRTDCMVGVADVDDATFDEFYANHDAFRAVDAEEWLAMTSGIAPVPTGDPVSDAAQAVSADAKKRAPAKPKDAPTPPPANPLAPPPPPAQS